MQIESQSFNQAEKPQNYSSIRRVDGSTREHTVNKTSTLLSQRMGIILYKKRSFLTTNTTTDNNAESLISKTVEHKKGQEPEAFELMGKTDFGNWIYKESIRATNKWEEFRRS